MTPYEDDQQLFRLMKAELFTAVVGDVLDAAGCTRQFLPPQIKPLDAGMMVAGRAMPVLEADCHGETVAASGERQPFGLMFEALDALQPNDVYICTGSSPAYALWGELMSTRAMKLRAAGAVLDGYSRDTRGILRLGFPTFSHGTYAQDQRVRGRVIDFRCPIRFGNGVVVEPGDIVFGDEDGVVIIPRQHERNIIQAALDKVRGENRVRAAIEAGMSTVEAFRSFGIM
ncbi:MAG: RraA family protein [Anaerolineae bacterium]